MYNKVGKNINDGPKMLNNYCYFFNIGPFAIAPYSIIALHLLYFIFVISFCFFSLLFFL